MLVPKKNRLAVYTYLFKEGVIVAKKDHTMQKHGQVEVPNLHVVKLLQSLKSKGLVKEIFSWRWFYYTLTNEGIDYLRDYLHVSADTVPATLKKPTKPQPAPSFGSQSRGGGRGGRGGRGGGGRGGGRGGFRGDRDGYRGPPKSAGAPGDFNPEFSGGRGGGCGGGRGGGRGGGAPRGRGGY